MHQLHRRDLVCGLSAAAFAGTAFPALAQTPRANPQAMGFSPAGIRAFNQRFHQLVDEQKLAGVVTLIARRGRVVNLDAYGRKNAAQPAPVRTDSIFRIASMTKPVGGAALMILHDEGKWRMDDPVARHIPQFANLRVRGANGQLEAPRTPMLMRHLVSHTAGFDRSAAYDSAGLQDGDLQDMIDKLATLPLAFHPGADWRYGPSVNIQGYVAQKLSGMPLEAFMKARIFDPLGMKDTGFFVEPEKVSRVVSIHTYRDGKIVPAGANNVVRTSPPRFTSASGGLLSTAEDYWRFSQMILNGGELNGKRILSPEAVRIMRTNVLEPGVNVTLYSPDTRGLGFGVDYAIVLDQQANGTKQAKNSFYWGGAFGTWFWIDPDNDMIVIGMIQNTNGSTPTGGSPPVREISAESAYAALTNPSA